MPHVKGMREMLRQRGGLDRLGQSGVLHMVVMLHEALSSISLLVLIYVKELIITLPPTWKAMASSVPQSSL